MVLILHFATKFNQIRRWPDLWKLHMIAYVTGSVKTLHIVMYFPQFYKNSFIVLIAQPNFDFK